MVLYFLPENARVGVYVALTFSHRFILFSILTIYDLLTTHHDSPITMYSVSAI